MCVSLSLSLFCRAPTGPSTPTQRRTRCPLGQRRGPVQERGWVHRDAHTAWIPWTGSLFIFCPSSFVYFFLLVTYFCVSLSVSLVPPSFSVFLSIFCSRSRSLSYSIFDSPTLALILARSKCLSLSVSLFLSHTHTRAHTHTYSSALVIRHACHMWTHTEAHSGSCCRLHASGLHLHPAPVAPS